MAVATVLWATALSVVSAAPLGTEVEATVAPRRIEPTAWSTDLVDPAGLTRFHLVTRTTFSDGASVISDASAWSLEARAHLNLVEGIALAAVLPLGISTGRADSPSEAFLGNIGLGLSVGGDLSRAPGRLVRLAGGFDAYLPTAAEPKDAAAGAGRGTIAAIRAYEPQLYVSKMLSFRLRGLAELTLDSLSAQVEVGLVPGVTLTAQKDFELLLAVAGRVSARVLDEVEPYLELGATTQIGGVGEIAPPLLLTPGVRFHFAEVFDPALFVSFNFITPSAIIFGLDLASLIRPDGKPSHAKKGREEFLGDF